MKILCLLVVALFLSLDSHAQTNELAPDLKAILRVRAEREQALILNSRIVVDYGRVVQFQLHPTAFLTAIKKIDTAACPKDFQLAWFDYITDREDAVRKAQRGGGEVLIDLMGMARGGSAAIAGLKDLDRIGEESAGDAWRKVERVALGDGLDLTKKQ